MNLGLRGGVQMLSEAVRVGYRSDRLMRQEEVVKLNRRVKIAKSVVWQELKQDILLMIDQEEATLHSTDSADTMRDARGASNALMLLVDMIESAEARRMALQQEQERLDKEMTRMEQEAAADDGMGPSPADNIGGQHA